MSTIKNKQAVMGFKTAKQRASCINCAHGEERICVTPTWWCENGRFLTSAFSVCDEHKYRVAQVAT